MSHFSENTTRFTVSAEIFEQTTSKVKNTESPSMELDEDNLVENQNDESKSQQQ